MGTDHNRFMTECWLKPNRRPTYVALAIGLLVVLISGVGITLAWRNGSTIGLLFASFGLTAGGVCCLTCWFALRRARVTYFDGSLFVHDGSQSPVSVPIDVVEVFFLGSGPAIHDEAGDSGPRTANVVIRIAESANQWHQGELAPAVGKWSEGYIVLRGTWCEPIGHDRLNELNRRLAEIHRLQRKQGSTNAQVAV